MVTSNTSTFQQAFAGRSVFLTGHTGFKGSWLSLWLHRLGARVHGFALDPKPHETLFETLDVSSALAADVRADIRNATALKNAIFDARPDFVFHMAAQPLVRLSFDIPIDTFAINVMGTVNVLEALRDYGRPCHVVIVTTDKCYENQEWLHSYREVDPMGGYDPYSASKGCAELVVNSYRRSFFGDDSPINVASARAGNVIGGGDWAMDRIVPDIFRALFAGNPIPVRNRTATRPWQHVLEPLSGYLTLAAVMADQPGSYCEPFNFGPNLTSNRTVLEIVEKVLQMTPGSWEDRSDPDAPHEASKLNLSVDKAFHCLGWQPAWDFQTTIEKTVDWYVREHAGESAKQLSIEQIQTFEQTRFDSALCHSSNPERAIH